jgi:glutamine amidotransferase
MIAIIDYGAGNLFSVKNALDHLGFENMVTDSKQAIQKADRLILPGVGAFPDAMEMLREKGLEEVILEESKKKPLLGICLGMQMLFEYGNEFSKTKGLSLIPGAVTAIDAPGLKIPHMGWSALKLENECPLTVGIKEGDMVFYVHSYKAETDSEYISMFSEYGGVIPGIVFHKNIYGTQFHPEKSGKIGLTILKNFGGLT